MRNHSKDHVKYCGIGFHSSLIVYNRHVAQQEFRSLLSKKEIIKLINTIPNEFFVRKLLQGKSIDAKQTLFYDCEANFLQNIYFLYLKQFLLATSRRPRCSLHDVSKLKMQLYVQDIVRPLRRAVRRLQLNRPHVEGAL